MKKKLLYLVLLTVFMVGLLLPQVAMAQTTVVTGIETDIQAFRTTSFATANRQWTFYAISSALYYKSSTDLTGTSWGSQQAVGFTYGVQTGWDICFDGTYVHIAATQGNNYLQYKGGVPSDATGTITWDTQATFGFAGTGANMYYPTIAVDSSGYKHIIVYSQYSYGKYHLKSTTANDTAFVESFRNAITVSGTKWELHAMTDNDLVLISRDTGWDYLYAKRYDAGSDSWDAAAHTTSKMANHYYGQWSSVSQDDVVHVTFLNFENVGSTYDIVYTAYDKTTNSFSAETVLYDNISIVYDTDFPTPAITRDSSSDNLWVFTELDAPGDDTITAAMYNAISQTWAVGGGWATCDVGLTDALSDNLSAPEAQSYEQLGLFWTASTSTLRFKQLAEEFDVDTVTPDPVGETTATLKGDIVALGFGAADYRGFIWNTEPSMTGATDWHEDGTWGTGAYSQAVGNLTEGDSYYVMAYAGNGFGEAYGSWMEFNPGGTGGWSVLTLAPTNVEDDTATFNAEITEVAGENATIRGFQYGYTETPTWFWNETGNYTVGLYDYDITDLLADTIYYVRAYAGNSTVVDYGSWVGFITQQPSYSDEDNPPGDDTGLTPPMPGEPGGWIRPPKDWGDIGLPGAQIPLTFFVWILLTGFIVLVGFGITKFTRSLVVLFMVLGFILGIFSFWPKGGYLDWWIMLPYFLVGWALLSRQKDSPISE